MRIEPCGLGAAPVFLTAVAADGNQAHQAAPRLPANLGRELVAIHTRQADIAEHCVRYHRQRSVERRCAIVRLEHLVTLGLDQERHHIGRVRMILDDEHAELTRESGCLAGLAAARVSRSALVGEPWPAHDELAAPTVAVALRVYGMAMQVEQYEHL